MVDFSTLLSPSAEAAAADKPLLFTIALLYAAFSSHNYSQGQRAATVYAYCLIMHFLGAVEATWAAVGGAVTLFLVLEVFSQDGDLISLYSVPYKVLDFVYRLIFELYGWLFYLMLFFHWHLISSVESHALVSLLVLTSTIVLATLVARHRFASLPVTEIIAAIKCAAGDPALSPRDSDSEAKYDILVFMEDGTFLTRSEKTHILTPRALAPKIWRRIRRFIRDGRSLRSINRGNLARHIRGYGTIEMQLLRSIGLKFGSYQLTLRRKAFELVFSQTIFNSYLAQLNPESDARKRFSYWVLQAYTSIVSVKVGETACRPNRDSSTFAQLFGKEFSELSQEEFFVWCLGLPHYELGVGPNAVAIHQDAMERFGLNRQKIDEAIKTARERCSAGSRAREETAPASPTKVQ